MDYKQQNIELEIANQALRVQLIQAKETITKLREQINRLEAEWNYAHENELAALRRLNEVEG